MMDWWYTYVVLLIAILFVYYLLTPSCTLTSLPLSFQNGWSTPHIYPSLSNRIICTQTPSDIAIHYGTSWSRHHTLGLPNMKNPRLFEHDGIMYILASSHLITLNLQNHVQRILPIEQGVLFHDQNQVFLMTDVYPILRIKTVDLDTCSTTLCIEKDTKDFFKLPDGCTVQTGTTCVSWKNQLLCGVQVYHKKTVRTLFFTLQPTVFTPVSHTPLYTFTNNLNEMVSGLEWNQSVLWCTVTIGNTGHLVEMQADLLEWV